MNNENRKQRPQRYEIVVEGLLDPGWVEWLGGMQMENGADGTTRLSGSVIDQAGLYGLLSRLRDLGVPLLLVRRLSDTDGDTKVKGGKS
jgi:hypothetical protein